LLAEFELEMQDITKRECSGFIAMPRTLIEFVGWTVWRTLPEG
jgi:hypothetical protein